MTMIAVAAIGRRRVGFLPSSGARDPAQLVLGFGNLGERTMREGIAAVVGILRAEHKAPPGAD
ncbi:hypothetical protein OG741_31190 [Streptomyces sp. NBC_01410]|uniref:hypothetical protein n=1 Tax=Streptomyces sp. NBC_01410 TaxID=2903856 RepID=UPI003243F79E